MVLISIDGNIGAGKSLLTDILAKNDMKVSKEPTGDWEVKDEDGVEYNVLEAFYQDPKRYATLFQTLVLRTRVEQSKNITHGFVERCVSSDLMFGKIQRDEGNMSPIEYATYYYQYKQAVRDTPTINGYIYVRTSAQTCKKRILKRNRKGEDQIDPEYLDKLHEQHEIWLNKPSDATILILDGEKDLTDPENQKEVVQKIKTFLLRVSKN
jgi:deoxyadenosine/deoxycytidine kinase